MTQLLLDNGSRKVLSDWLAEMVAGKTGLPKGFRHDRFYAFLNAESASINIIELSALVEFYDNATIYEHLNLTVDPSKAKTLELE